MKSTVALPRRPGAIAPVAHVESRVQPGLLDRDAWRDAALVWLAQRVAFFLLTILGWLLPIAHAPEVPKGDWLRLYAPWAGIMDAKFFAAIAREGYAHPWQAAYFPAFPLVERTLAPLTLGHPTIAGLIAANLAGLAAFALLRVLIEREADRATARRTLLYVAVFPTSLFLATAYTEALFLLLSVGALLALRRRRWLTAGLLVALAALTRQVGILLLVPLVVEMALSLRGRKERRRRPEPRELLRMVGGLTLPVLALAGFALYLATRFGSPFANAAAEEGAWDRRLSVPWYGLQHAALAVLHEQGSYQVLPLIDIAIMLAAIAVAAAMVRRFDLPPAYIFYACAMLAVVLVEPLHAADWAALHSQPRYVLVICPLFWFVARREPRPLVKRVALGCSLWLLAVFVVAFVNGTWVA